MLSVKVNRVLVLFSQLLDLPVQIVVGLRRMWNAVLLTLCAPVPQFFLSMMLWLISPRVDGLNPVLFLVPDNDSQANVLTTRK